MLKRIKGNEDALPYELARELFDYDPATGKITWLKNRGARKVAGKEAGSADGAHGRIRIRAQGRSYWAHRLAWLLHYGVWPVGFVDHVNGDPSDNRIENLREATHAENARNARISKNNQSGYKGVALRPAGRYGLARDRYVAILVSGGQRHHLGSFDTPEEAHEAYKAAAVRYHGEFARFK